MSQLRQIKFTSGEINCLSSMIDYKNRYDSDLIQTYKKFLIFIFDKLSSTTQ